MELNAQTDAELVAELWKHALSGAATHATKVADPKLDRLCAEMRRAYGLDADRDERLASLSRISLALATELKVDHGAGGRSGKLAHQAYECAIALSGALEDWELAIGSQRERFKTKTQEQWILAVDALAMFAKYATWDRLARWIAAFAGSGMTTEPVITSPPPDALKEVLVFGSQRDTRVAAGFVEKAVVVMRSVARLSVPRVRHGHPDGRHAFGTGWLVAPGLLLTNHHVVEARDKRPSPFGLGESDARDEDIDAQVAGLEIWFDYHRDDPARPPTCRGAALKAKDRKLDFALLELDMTTPELASRDALSMISEQPQPMRGRRANIVQHPGGRALVLAIRNNFIVGPGPEPHLVLYQTDTESGASGSPVCDDDWRVIALHHGSVKVPSQVVPQEVMDGQERAVVLLNEATAIHAVLAAIKQQSPEYHARIVKANGWL